MVKCKLCGERAVVKIRYAKTYLCPKHFTEFIERKVKKSLIRYRMVSRGSKMAVAISGGKDSAVMLHVLSKLSKDMGFNLIAIHIDLGIEGYSEKCVDAVLSLTSSLGIKCLVVRLKDLVGRGVGDLARITKRPPCSVCGIVKRYLINAVSIELGVDAVALGHNADDIIAYTFKSFMLQDLESIPKLGPKTESIDDLAVGRIRPLYEVYEKETLIYALVNKVPFVQDRCPLMPRKSLEFKIKDVFTDLEYSMPGIKLSYLKNLARRLSDYPKPGTPVRSCGVCGLISSEPKCGFCKLTERVTGRALGKEVRDRLKSLIINLV